MAYRALLTPSSAVHILDEHLGRRGLHHTTADSYISIPYHGFQLKFSSSATNQVRTFLLANVENNIEDEHQRSVAAAYFAKVNFHIRNGSFQLKLQDGQAMYYSALPLEDMTVADCRALIPDWFDLFLATFTVHFIGIEAIRRGATVEAAERAVEKARSEASERPSSDRPTERSAWNPPIPAASAPSPAWNPPVPAASAPSPAPPRPPAPAPAPAPSPAPSSTRSRPLPDLVRLAFKDVLCKEGRCTSLDSAVEGASHVMHGVYEYKNTTAVIWACDETDSKVFELRVFMLETVPAARLERVSRFIENANQQVTLGGFKLDIPNRRLFYGYSVPYGGLTNGQLPVFIGGKSLALCLGTHLEFLPAIRAIIHDGAAVSAASTFHTARGEEDSDFHRNELARSRRPAAKTTSAAPRPVPEPKGTDPKVAYTAPPRPPTGVAADADLRKAPVLALDDLVFEDGGVSVGGMGQVKKAVYRRGTEVAVKELLDRVDMSGYNYFLREIQVYFSIPPCPHIVPMLGVTPLSKSNPSLRLVTEWCGGGSLHDLLHNVFGGYHDADTITYGKALKFAHDIAAGVDHLHQQGLVHLDLKPGNIMLDEHCAKAKITDFGLAKIKASPSQTTNRHTGGTPGFQAPEVIEPGAFTREERAGVHSDVYALGVTIFLLFSGLTRPFHTSLPTFAINDKVAAKGQRPLFPSAFSWPGGQDATKMVKSVIQACWVRDPKKRPSAYQVMEHLDDIKSKVESAGGMEQVIPVSAHEDPTVSGMYF